MASSNVQAQRRQVIIVRPYPYGIYRPFGFRSWWGPYGWGYDPWSPYGSYYRHYIFESSDDALNQGYKDGFKTGKTQNEQMISGLPPITDMRRWPCRYQTFYLKPFMRRCGGHSRRQLLANAAIAASRVGS